MRIPRSRPEKLIRCLLDDVSQAFTSYKPALGVAFAIQRRAVSLGKVTPDSKN